MEHSYIVMLEVVIFAFDFHINSWLLVLCIFFLKVKVKVMNCIQYQIIL